MSVLSFTHSLRILVDAWYCCRIAALTYFSTFPALDYIMIWWIRVLVVLYIKIPLFNAPNFQFCVSWLVRMIFMNCFLLWHTLIKMLDSVLTFDIFKSGTNMNWNWTSRDSGKSFDRPALRRFLSLLILFDSLMQILHVVVDDDKSGVDSAFTFPCRKKKRPWISA